ncbi:MAG: hypothetical protein AB2L24_22180 [Mangrovibacterium sp.]
MKQRNLILYLVTVLFASGISFFIGRLFQPNEQPGRNKPTERITERIGESISIKRWQSQTCLSFAEHKKRLLKMNSNNKWTRCFLTTDGMIYLKDSLKSVDKGKNNRFTCRY